MADADLSQTEADRLLKMQKISATQGVHDYPGPGEKAALPLVSEDNREQFTLDLGRGRIEITKVKYQNRARQIVILARVDLNGPPHRNPDGTQMSCPHLHVYREGHADKWAVPLSGEHFSSPDDLWQTLQDFMDFCNIVEPPQVRRGLYE